MNSPDRASDHLANERTFLAWVRTSVALLGLGFVLAKFGFWLRQLALLESHRAVPNTGASLVIGLGLLAFGAAVAVIGLLRYQTVRRALEQGVFRASNKTIMGTTLAIVTTTVLLMAYLLVTNQNV